VSKTLTQMATEVLQTADGREKTAVSKSYAEMWFAARAAGDTIEIGTANPPLHPARPEKPELLSPRDVPKRKPGSEAGRIALLHAVAHIELNAVDLHWDIIARFGHVKMPIGFYDDWVKSAAGMIDIFAKANATQAVDALNVIYSEEVAHVAYGSKWFNFMCGRDNLDPKDVFHTLVRKYFKGALKAPFNEEKRADAGLPPDFYWPLADQMGVDLRLEGSK